MDLVIGSGSITINNKTYEGRCVSITNGVVSIDGVKQNEDLGSASIIVTVNGDVEKIETTNGEVHVNGNTQTVKTMDGNVVCGNILGDVKTHSGNVVCKNVDGDIKTHSGNIRHQNA